MTQGGRLFYIFYCIIGMPVGLVFVANLGKSIEKGVGYIVERIKRYVKRKKMNLKKQSYPWKIGRWKETKARGWKRIWIRRIVLPYSLHFLHCFGSIYHVCTRWVWHCWWSLSQFHSIDSCGWNKFLFSKVSIVLFPNYRLSTW